MRAADSASLIPQPALTERRARTPVSGRSLDEHAAVTVQRCIRRHMKDKTISTSRKNHHHQTGENFTPKQYDSSKYSQTPPKKEPRKLTEEYTTSAKISEKVKLIATTYNNCHNTLKATETAGAVSVPHQAPLTIIDKTRPDLDENTRIGDKENRKLPFRPPIRQHHPVRAFGSHLSHTTGGSNNKVVEPNLRQVPECQLLDQSIEFYSEEEQEDPRKPTRLSDCVLESLGNISKIDHLEEQVPHGHLNSIELPLGSNTLPLRSSPEPEVLIAATSEFLTSNGVSVSPRHPIDYSGNHFNPGSAAAVTPRGNATPRRDVTPKAVRSEIIKKTNDKYNKQKLIRQNSEIVKQQIQRANQALSENERRLSNARTPTRANKSTAKDPNALRESSVQRHNDHHDLKQAKLERDERLKREAQEQSRVNSSSKSKPKHQSANVEQRSRTPPVKGSSLRQPITRSASARQFDAPRQHQSRSNTPITTAEETRQEPPLKIIIVRSDKSRERCIRGGNIDTPNRPITPTRPARTPKSAAPTTYETEHRAPINVHHNNITEISVQDLPRTAEATQEPHNMPSTLENLAAAAGRRAVRDTRNADEAPTPIPVTGKADSSNRQQQPADDARSVKTETFDSPVAQRVLSPSPRSRMAQNVSFRAETAADRTPGAASVRTDRPDARDGKIGEILDFLDEVEATSRADMSELSAQRDGDLGYSSVCEETQGAIQSRITMLEIELRDKKKMVAGLRKTLADQRSREEMLESRIEKEWTAKMQVQKKEFEAGLERQLQMVDRLLGDKSELTNKCEILSAEIKTVENKYESKLQTLNDQLGREMNRQKSNWSAQERNRREEWEKVRAREIKEDTIKGLEPEVERLLGEHKKEMKVLQEEQADQLANLRAEVIAQCERKFRAEKEHLKHEHEVELAQEREIGHQRIRSEVDKNYQKIADEQNDFSHKLREERKNMDQEIRDTIAQNETRHADDMTKVIDDYERKLDDLKEQKAEVARRAALDEANAREAEKITRETWQSSVAEKLQNESKEREEIVRAQLERKYDVQRDELLAKVQREVNDAHRRFETEKDAAIVAGKADLQRDHETLQARYESLEKTTASLRHVIDAHASERKEWERRLEVQTAAARETHEARLELEREIGGLKSELATKDGVKDIEVSAARAENGEALASLRAEVADLTKVLAATKQKAEHVIGDQQRRETESITAIEEKLKEALEKKDRVIEELRAQRSAQENKLREFEYLLERQREELLGDISGPRHNSVSAAFEAAQANYQAAKAKTPQLRRE